MEHLRARTPAFAWWRPLAALVLLILLWQVVDVLLLVFGAILLSLVLGALASGVRARTGLNRGLSVAVALLGSLAWMALGLYLLGEAVAGQMQALAQQVPQTFQDLRTWLEGSRWGEWIQLPTMEQLSQSRGGLMSRASGYVYTGVGTLGSILMLVVLAAWMAVDPHTYREGAVRLFPPSRRDRIRGVMDEAARFMRCWLKAKALNMLVAAAMTSVGLWALGIPMALALGVVAGLLEFVPNLGPLLASVPALLVALPLGWGKVAAVAGLYTGVQLVQSNLITPWIEKWMADLPPALVLVAQVVLGTLVGAVGVILAAPLTAVAMVLVRRLYVEDALERGGRLHLDA